MQAMQAGLALPTLPAGLLPVLRGSWAGRGWPGTRARPGMRGDKGGALVRAADPQAQGAPGAWGLCPVRPGPSAFPAVWALRGNSHMGQPHPHCPGVSPSTCRAWAGSGDMWEACREWGHTRQRRWGGMSPPQGLGALGLRCSCGRWTPLASVSPQEE